MNTESTIPYENCLSVVMPVYNEAATVERAIEAVLKQPCVKELIVVNDGSTDGTRETLQRLEELTPKLRVFHHESNRGKGAAVNTGFNHAEAPVVLVQDADLEYTPDDYRGLLEPILAGKADVVFGSRFLGGHAHRVLYFWHSVGNKFLTLLSNMVTNLNLTDIECCYKVFRREVLSKITIREPGFGIEPELTAKVARLKVRLFEVSVGYYGRTYEEGKKIGWKDGVWAFWCILKYGLLRRA